MNGYLALLDQTDRVVHEFREYPQQYADVSFGISMPDVPADTKYTLYPEYRNTIRDTYEPPAFCGRYCCGWIERQGLPGGAPNLTCNDGGFAELGPRFGRETLEEE